MPVLHRRAACRFSIKGLAIHTWERTWQYIKKAGTVILGIAILLWAMMTYPILPEEKLQTYEGARQAFIGRLFYDPPVFILQRPEG